MRHPLRHTGAALVALSLAWACSGTPAGPSPQERLQRWEAQVDGLLGRLEKPPSLDTLYQRRYGPRADSRTPSFLLMADEQLLARVSAARPQPEDPISEARIRDGVTKLTKVFMALAQRRAALIAERLLRTGHKRAGFCVPRDRRGKDKGCPYPGVEDLCATHMLAQYPSLGHVVTAPVRREELAGALSAAFQTHVAKIEAKRDTCYGRTLKRQPRRADTYKGDDRGALIRQARLAWRRLFGDEPLLGVTLSGPAWRRDIFSRVVNGRRQLFDLGSLRGFTYRDVGGGIARGERIRWRVDHLNKRKWVELCSDKARNSAACETHDVRRAAVPPLPHSSL